MYVQSGHLINNLHHIVLENMSKRSQNILEMPIHHQFVLCSVAAMANSMYKHPKIKFVLQWIHNENVDLLEWAHGQPFLTGALSTTCDKGISATETDYLQFIICNYKLFAIRYNIREETLLFAVLLIVKM